MKSTIDEVLDRVIVAYVKAVVILDPIRLRFWDRRGLTMPQLRIMFMLSSHDGATPGLLAGKMRVTPSTVTGLTDRLVRQGLIRRSEDREDRRLVRLYLTEEGVRVTSQLEVAGRAYLKEILGRLSPDRLEQLADSLEELWAASEALESAAAPSR